MPPHANLPFIRKIAHGNGILVTFKRCDGKHDRRFSLLYSIDINHQCRAGFEDKTANHRSLCQRGARPSRETGGTFA